MKNTILKTAFLTVGLALSLTACHDLDMSPLSSGSTENWYSNLEEVRMAVNAGYNNEYLLVDGELGESNNEWSDDSHFRQAVDAFQNATLLYNIYHRCATESLRLSLSSVLWAMIIFLSRSCFSSSPTLLSS